MKLNIGKTIRRLRREREMTQEDFAEFLGVSCQSVSRWENDQCYPDIELIPIIAGFFRISTDRLLGMDIEEERKAAAAFQDAFQNAVSKGDIAGCIRIAREGISEYPNNFQLLNKLMYALFLASDPTGNIPEWKENMEKYDAEIVSLGERIMNYCTDDDVRFEAIARLAFHHCEMGRKSVGRRIYQKLTPIQQCRETYQWWSLEEEEKLPFVRHYVRESYHQFQHALELLAENGLLSNEEALEVMQIRMRISELTEGTDGAKYKYHPAHDHYEMAKLLAVLGRADEMFAHLSAAADAAIMFDNRPESRQISSLLLGEITWKRSDFDTADSRPVCEIMREEWLTNNVFSEYTFDERWPQIAERLACTS